MYSFEGDFKRRPQQCLSGASTITERNELLEHARQQRQKREEHRKRTKSTVQIQAYVRSYLTRKRVKELQRGFFDLILKSLRMQPVTEQNLNELIKKLLFFYSEDKDGNRLVSISQLVLKDHSKILELAVEKGSAWSWHVKRLLHLNLGHIVALVKTNSTDSMAVSLRVLEVFTSIESTQKVIGLDNAKALLNQEFGFLVEKGYFERLRFLLDKKTPPLLSVSSQPPTPLVGCLFNMLTRPLQMGDGFMSPIFIVLLRSFCQHIFAPPLTEPIKLFVIPALQDAPSFPFRQLIQVLRDSPVCPESSSVSSSSHSSPHSIPQSIPHSTGLLFSVLALERKHFMQATREGNSELICYLQVLASLTHNICRLGLQSKEEELEDLGEDVDVEMDEPAVAEEREDREVLEECVNLLNNVSRVQTLLLSIDETEEPLVLQALCQICHNLLISSKLAVHKYRLLYMLAFKPSFLRHLWAAIQRVNQTSVFGCATPLINIIARGVPVTGEESQRLVPLLAVFCSLFSLLIATLHDGEFYGDENGSGTVQTMPFTLPQLVPMSRQLKEVCLGLVDLAFPDSRPAISRSIHGLEVNSVPPQQTHLWSNLFKVVVGLVRHLHARDNRRSFCPDGHWISKQVQIILGVYQPSDFAFNRRRRLRGYRPFRGLRAFTREELEDGGPPLTTKEVRTATLLNELPFLVAFQERVVVFQTIVLKDKMEHQGDAMHFLQGPSINISVRRNYLYEDAFDKLSLANEPELRLKMHVQLVNRAGLDEAGVDGGGLFREFLSELLKTAFDPNRGFFRLTKDNLLYPNPSVQLLVDDFTKHYFFIGRLLGKALYENLLVELPFAEFFLFKLVGRHSDVDIHHLASLDPIMYRNLLFLKSYEGDVLDLGLDFTIMTEELGETRTDELKPAGSSIPVTSSNRIEYIHLMADYKVNRQIRAQCNAFRQGLANVIPLEWIHMFNSKELQVLISGAEIPVDMDDLKQHTNYAGGYTDEHPTIKIFWKVVRNFSDMQKRLLLKFVTSCSRPPLLGFKELDPPFCVQHAGTNDRLPTASTCMNLLKLPEFPNEKLMADKLTYAIQAGAGFELS